MLLKLPIFDGLPQPFQPSQFKGLHDQDLVVQLLKSSTKCSPKYDHSSVCGLSHAMPHMMPHATCHAMPCHATPGVRGRIWRQDRIGPDRAGQDRTGPGRTRQDRTGQDRTGPDRTRQDRTRQDMT
jgi:hypothetical protein